MAEALFRDQWLFLDRKKKNYPIVTYPILVGFLLTLNPLPPPFVLNLQYYKSQKMTKLLAALSLSQVGKIVINGKHLFTIHVMCLVP